MFDFAIYQVTKLDEKRSIFRQIHVFDIMGWGSNQSLQKSVVKNRGMNMRKELIKHMENKPNDFSFKSMEDQLKKDPIGRLILEINIEKIQNEYDKSIMVDKNNVNNN
jgi:hypothetical protein